MEKQLDYFYFQLAIQTAKIKMLMLEIYLEEMTKDYNNFLKTL